jgi:RNA polymerase sigma-54 factor
MGTQRLKQKQYQTLSPQQIQFLGVLQLPVLSLEKRIEEELEENPTLDEEESLEENAVVFKSPSSNQNVGDFQIADASNSVQDHLIKQLIDLNLPDSVLFLVEYLINSIDDNGFLNRDLYSISSDLLTNTNNVVSEKELQLALKILQDLDPPGIGAKDLQDCLLLQLKKSYPNEKIAFKIISEYYTPFSNKNFEHLMKNLTLSKKDLKGVYVLIESLTPFPAAGFSINTAPANYIYPDFIISIINNALQLKLNKGNVKGLKISKYYSDLLLKTNDNDTKEFLAQKIDKARWFKESMEKRESTLRKVMKAIMELQKDYLISGFETDLKPMKLADIADVVKMDISTISRVSNSKFIETHFGTFKVKELFSDAFRKDNGEVISTTVIKTQLKEIVLREDKLRPFTDEKLSELLGKDEYHIARRTVAKYREQLGIETAKLRRTL